MLKPASYVVHPANASHMCFVDQMGGWLDRRELVPPKELRAGSRHVIAPLESITRELWGTPGTLRQIGNRWLLEFDQVTKAVGARVTGLHITDRKQLI